MDDLGRSLLDSVEDAVIVTDTDLTVIGWNGAMETLSGLPRQNAVGKDAGEALRFLGDPELSSRLRAALAGGTCGAVETSYTMPGQERQVRLRTSCVPWRVADRIAGAIVFLRDVTEWRRGTVVVRAIEAIGQSLRSSLDLNEVLDTIVGAALEVLGAEGALVVSCDGQAPDLTVMRVAGRLSKDYAPAMKLPAGGGPISRAVHQARPIVTSNILTDPDVWLPPERRAQIEVEGFKAVAAAPLASKGRVHGALAVHYWTERAFSAEELGALELLAEQAALAIDNARVYADATRRADRLRELAEVEQLVAGSLDVDDVLERIAGATARLVGAPVVQVFTADPVARVLRLRAASTPSGGEVSGLPATIAFGEGIAGRAAAGKMPFYVSDVTRDGRALSAEWARESGIVKMLVVPLLVGEEVLGVLTVRSRTESLSDEENRALISSLAAQAAAAIQNARAYAEAVRRAGRLQELVAASQAINASLETSDVMQRIANAAAAMRPRALASVHVLDPERKVLRYAANAGAQRQGLPGEISASAGLPGLVFELRAPVLVADPQHHPRSLLAAWWRERPSATYYGVPITSGDAFVGVLNYVALDGLPDAEEQEALRLLAAHAGVAIRNAGLFQTERLQAERIRALTTVNRRISSALQLDELLRTICESAAQLTGVRFASFWLADEAHRTVALVACSVPEMAEEFPLKVVRYDQGLAGWIARHRTPLVIDDLAADDRLLAGSWRERWGLEAFAGYPVLAGDELLAVLCLSHSEPIAFAADTRDVIEMFIAQAAVAIQNARLYREAQRRRDIAEGLSRLGRELAATLDVERIAEVIAEGLADLLGVKASTVFRYEPADGTLHAVSSSGAEGGPLRGRVLAPGEGVSGRAVAERRIIATPDVLADPSIRLSPDFRRLIEGQEQRAVVAVPLVAGSRILGVLTLGARAGREFTPDEVQTLRAFGDQAALALENARLYASARDSLERLKDTQAQLVQAAKLSAVGQLVSGVAHELNNPLSVIIGYGQLLLSRQMPAAVHRPVELIVAQADRMAKIVRNLLYFARQRPPERTAVDLHQVIEQTLLLRQNQLTLSGINVEREFAPDLPRVSGDSQQLEQVLLNLILNAEQAILEVGTSGRIVLRTRPGDTSETAIAEVIDDGPGIPPDVLPHVFEPFFTTKSVGVGTGLGLSVSYGIIQEHGGRLSVESEPGRTVFTVELAVAPPTEAPAETAAAAPEAVAGSGRLALVVEDEPSVLDLIVTLLSHTGWRVDVAPGGRAGLARVRERQYDLVVSDMRMPEGGGEEFYRKASAEQPALARRFVFITGDTANPGAWAFLDGTNVPIVEKPFQPTFFLDAVRRVTTALTPLGSGA